MRWPISGGGKHSGYKAHPRTAIDGFSYCSPNFRRNIVCAGAKRSASRISSGEDDHARFARLLMPHLGDAYSLARWITSNGADAEDVVQDACLRAFRAVGGVADDSARRCC